MSEGTFDVLPAAERGMVAFSAQYRLISQEGVKIDDCVKDAKSAFRWVRGHAAELGIDPEKADPVRA